MLDLGLVLLPLVGLYSLGGWGELTTRLTAIDPALLAWGGADGWTLMTVSSTLGLALIGLGFLGSPQVFVRFLALRDVEEVPKGMLVSWSGTIMS